jgi:hypothetical protein
MVQAGTLAASFLATPFVLPGDLGHLRAARPGLANTIRPGERVRKETADQLKARYGQDAYDEATVEYVLSRILRLHKTFSDAQTQTGFASFRNVDRAGFDLLLFFSF